MKLHIIFTPPNLPFPRGGKEGGAVHSMRLHIKVADKYGVSVDQIPESPLQKADKPLHWDEKLGVRVR